MHSGGSDAADPPPRRPYAQSPRRRPAAPPISRDGRARPRMDERAPIAATVPVDRRAPVKSSRSTLATMADIEPYLAALFACEAIPVCPDCGVSAVATSATDAARRAATEMDGTRAL